VRALAAAVAVAALPMLASCGTGSVPVAKVASVPTSVDTPTSTPAPSPSPPIGDICPVGTWRLVKGTMAISFETPKGIVAVTVSGGAGELDHYFIDGTGVVNLAGTPFTGSSHGYRVVVRDSGTLRSPVIFTNDRETVEPIDSSAARLTVSINGSAPKTVPGASYEMFSYACNGNSLTEDAVTGDVFTYRRMSATP
jgi:hypothetical protein